MSDEIIDFYKKAADTEEPQKPIEEQKETPAPVLPRPDEPFGKFLLELAEKLKNEKVITEKQQETFQEQIKQPVLEEDKNSDDPFKKFIGSFANILKQDELVNREENIKEATINFINKLKEQPEEPFIIEDQPFVKTKKKYLPPTIAKKVQKLPQPIKKEEPVVAEQADEPVKEEQPKEENKYVQELKTADKSNKKLPEKIKSVSDIKSIVEKQVAEILSRYPNLGFTGGGGGTNAVQYAEGGTMRGDLNVTGKYLSGGIDLSTLIGSGGGGAADRLVSGTETLILCSDGTLVLPLSSTIRPQDGITLNLESEDPNFSSYTRITLSPYAFFAYDSEGNSVTFDKLDNAIVLTSQDLYEWTFNSDGRLVGPSGTLSVSGNVDVTNKFLSGGVDLADIFITSAEESQTLSYSEFAEQLSIARGNSVSLSSLSDKSYANSNFLKLSGGTVSGNLTIQGSISALGTATFANTIFTTTSALSVYNTGPGPALYVYQASGPYDVASFYDGDGIEVLHVGNSNVGGLGRVGVNVSTPNAELTVQGSISATNSIFATSILSGGVDLKDIFLTSETDSQTLSYIESSAELSISNGNTVILSALSGQKFNQSLNTTDNVQFNQVNTPLIVMGAGDFTIDESNLLWGGNIKFNLEEGAFYYNGEPKFSTIGEWYAPISFFGPNAAANAAQTRTNLGLGSADNVEFNQVNANVYLSGGTNLLNILSSSGSGGGDPAVNTVVYTYSATWIDTSTVVQNNSASWAAGGGGATEKRFDFVTTGGIDYSYSGTAAQYTIETSPTWKLIRLTYNNNGTISNSASALNSWTGRLTATYV